MGLKVNYIIKRPKGKMTYKILDISYVRDIKYFTVENMVNGNIYVTDAEGKNNWQYYGRIYDTIKPRPKKYSKFKFK